MNLVYLTRTYNPGRFLEIIVNVRHTLCTSDGNSNYNNINNLFL